MAQAPGVHIRETDVLRTIEGVPVDIAAAFGVTQRGPDDELRLVISFDDFQGKYGGFHQGSFLPHLVRGFFRQGGTALYIGRTVGSGAAKSSGAAAAVGGVADTVDILGRNVGEYGNSILSDFTKATTTITTITTALDTEVEVASVGQFELGDCIVIDDGTNKYTGIVVAVDVPNKLLKLSVALGFIFAVDVEVKTSTSHRAYTKIVTGFPVGQTAVQFTVANSFNIQVGDLLMVMTGDISGSYMFTELRVTGVNGSTLFADVLNEDNNVTTAMPADAHVTVQGFNVTTTYEGAGKTYSHISLESENQVNYVDERLGGDRNESDLVEMLDAGNVEVTAWRIEQYPAPASWAMSGGLDGAAPADVDYLGTNVLKAYKHGILLMDENYQISTFAIPGVSTAAVISGADSYANTKRLDFCGDAPLAADTLDELLEFRNFTLGLDTSFTAIYGPWFREENPQIPGALLELPCSCRQLGVDSYTAANEGVHKAPANVEYYDAVSLVADFSDVEHGILNEAGINLVRVFPGRGIRVFGARTLYSGRDGRQFISVRRLANYVERSVANLAFEFTFDVITEALWARIAGSIDRFLRNLWKAGMLYPRNDSTQAFFVLINQGLNPTEVVREGRVRGKVAFSPAPPAEQIELDVALWAGNSEIAEG